jgi:phosphoribosyl-dephospho-CoA transferase
MTWRLPQARAAARRHDLIFISPATWRGVLVTRLDLAADPVVAAWVDCGRPFVVRRLAPNEQRGLGVGLPLPPQHGKQRHGVVLKPADVETTAPPPRLSDAAHVAPHAWRSTIAAIVELAAEQDVAARVYGSLAWGLLTGLDYLTERSDIDLLLPLPSAEELPAVIARLAAIESAAPMRLDGEFMREDGAGVNWREIQSGAREVLVKTAHGVELMRADRFVQGLVQS